MVKATHEIRDPIHTFIKVDNDDRKVIDSNPVQRLRNVHQLALSYLVYPGATHKRFEHSLGVMELASQIFDIVTDQNNIHEEARKRFEQLNKDDAKMYWRKVLRIAALCHDIGHLPFSHAAEKELLPKDWDHEKLTRKLIESDEMENIWKSLSMPVRSEDIVKLAIGPGKASDLKFTEWEEILSDIITGDAFGADRIDYLLRDSYHSGVSYGKFDHHRMIDCLRILPHYTMHEGENGINALYLGLESGGIQSAEALLFARYQMYSQVYLHPVRRIYDIHLKDFLCRWLPGGNFPVNTEEHLSITDIEVLQGIRAATLDSNNPSHIHAKRIDSRNHFKVFYERVPSDRERNPDVMNLLSRAACQEFGNENIRSDVFTAKGGLNNFPVKVFDNEIASSLAISKTLRDLPEAVAGYIYVEHSLRSKAKEWLLEKKELILTNDGG